MSVAYSISMIVREMIRRKNMLETMAATDMLHCSKTEYSFLYHAPKTDRHSRKENKFMGETKQTYHFVVTLQELKQRAEK